jgi:hypothetical protein
MACLGAGRYAKNAPWEDIYLARLFEPEVAAQALLKEAGKEKPGAKK